MAKPECVYLVTERVGHAAAAAWAFRDRVGVPGPGGELRDRVWIWVREGL
jgi:hypothetical protein